MLNTDLGVIGKGHDVSPDGNELVYATPAGEIEVASAVDGSFLRQLTNGAYNDSDPDWNPDGNRVAFSRHPNDWSSWSPNDGIYAINSDGSNLAQLTALLDAYYELQPDWSPDGSKIALRYYGLMFSDNYIIVMESDGSNRLFIGDRGAHNPIWSTDGKRIIFERHGTVGYSIKTNFSVIASMNSDGSYIREITPRVENRYDYEPSNEF